MIAFVVYIVVLLFAFFKYISQSYYHISFMYRLCCTDIYIQILCVGGGGGVQVYVFWCE
jgi:hypothetical protein